jgi:hypothetical protein
MTTAYKRLAQIAEGLADAAANGRLEELEILAGEQSRLVAALPARPPAEALPHLEQAERANRSLQATLAARLAATREELVAIGGGRRLAQGYGGTGRTATFDAHG